MQSDIRNILFDIGNVLVDLDISRTIQAFTQLKIENLKPENIHPHQTGIFLEYELGTVGDREFVRALRDRYDCQDVSADRIFDAWSALLKDPDMSRFRIVAGLSENYRLFVLSNTNRQHIRFLKERFRSVSGGREFESYFERCFYSHRLHLRKPDPEIYRQVLKRAALKPEETLFVDDHACNLSAAEALGIKTFHLSGGMGLSELFE